MTKDFEARILNRSICSRFQRNNQKKPMICPIIPEDQYKKVAMDIFTFKGRDYLVVVDYFSKYPELCKLQNKFAATIVGELKSIFARHGILEKIVSDNMPFASREFKNFAQNWSIKYYNVKP